MGNPPIKVLIVADSVLVRQFVAQALAGEAGIQVIGSAADPLLALEKMRRQWPEVLVLDVETPRLDSLSFMRKVLAERATAIVICSSLAKRQGPATLAALAAGAVGSFCTPAIGVQPAAGHHAEAIVRAVRAAAQTCLPLQKRPTPALTNDLLRPKNSADVMLAAGPATGQRRGTASSIVAIGASTGGTQALEFGSGRACPTSCLGNGHRPAHAGALHRDAGAAPQRAVPDGSARGRQNGDRVVRRAGADRARRQAHAAQSAAAPNIWSTSSDGPLVNRHKPSVDVLFRSVARFAGGNALGIIMTGMGDDGARGLKEMRDAGARTIAQDEASCVVFGMPREAVRLGACRAGRWRSTGSPAPSLAFGRHRHAARRCVKGAWRHAASPRGLPPAKGRGTAAGVLRSEWRRVGCTSCSAHAASAYAPAMGIRGVIAASEPHTAVAGALPVCAGAATRSMRSSPPSSRRPSPNCR
jgi:two-component system chemotaxis response regulator CheB